MRMLIVRRRSLGSYPEGFNLNDTTCEQNGKIEKLRMQ